MTRDPDHGEDTKGRACVTGAKTNRRGPPERVYQSTSLFPLVVPGWPAVVPSLSFARLWFQFSIRCQLLEPETKAWISLSFPLVNKGPQDSLIVWLSLERILPAL